MRRKNGTKLLAAVAAMTLMNALPAMAAWQYTLLGPTAVWTESTTGQQVTVYAGQAAPDGTPAPTVTVTAETYSSEAARKASAAQTVAAANAAADAAKTARGGNVASDGTLSSAELAANTAAANAGLTQGTVTTITKTLSKSGSTGSNTYTNATLPTIKTGEQSSSTEQVTAGVYTSPTGTAVATTKNETSITTNTTLPKAMPLTGTTATNTTNTATTATTAAAQSTAASNVSQTATTAGYSGTLPSTGATNINTFTTPGA